MLLQGMRPAEVESLERTDTDFDTNTIRIRRGKSKAARRTLNLTGESRQILGRRLKGDSRWLFPSPRSPGEHISKLNSTHNAVCRRAALNFVLYDFRHTFCYPHGSGRNRFGHPRGYTRPQLAAECPALRASHCRTPACGDGSIRRRFASNRQTGTGSVALSDFDDDFGRMGPTEPD